MQAWLLLLAWPVAAQVRLGELSTSLSGTIAPGYSADYGNMTGSDHSWALGGAATLSGSFHDPNFLSFNVGLYLNQSRANSNFQSISNASGVNVTSTVFGGSRFPGAISYSKDYNSEGNYAVPGLANYVTHGNSDTFGINWSENIPDAPSFSAGFQMGSSQYSVYGMNDQGKNAFHSLNLHSAYSLAGFNMGAYFSSGGGHSLIPLVVAGQQTTETHSDNSGYGFNVTHLLPLKGSVSAGINRSSWNSDYLGSSSSGTIDTINSLAAVHPTGKLSLSASANYSDNLSGQLIQSVVAAGGVVPEFNTNETSNSLDLMGVASYTPVSNLQTSAYIERRTQNFLGETYGVRSLGGSATYAHTLFDGNFNTALNVTENTADKTGENTLGFSTTENYSSQILGWKVSGSFGYAQNLQTLLVTYMNSFYNYSGNARRRWGKFSVSAGAGAARTALTQQAGTANSSVSYNASMGYGMWLTADGSYSKANGQALATGAGLVPVPVPSPILPSDLVSLFGGDSYSFGLSSTPVKRLILAAAYSKSTSNTSSGTIASANQNNQFNVLIQYQFRKLNFNSGYARLEQGFSGSGMPPEVISSFYIGVSRWFNFF
ncbi:MAG: hypothetical protein WBM14_17590 [Terracidiphilus sp.]